MIAAFKSEVRKLLTVRSTYVLTILAFVMTGVISFWAIGYKFQGEMAPIFLQQAATSSLMAMSMLPAVIAILLITHEYRYNMIYYSLTAAKTRTRLFIAKVKVAGIYSIAFTAMIGAVAMLAAWIGLKVGGHELVPQKMWDPGVLWQSFFYVWATTMFGLLFGLIIRNQIGTIVAFLLFPGMIETLITFLIRGSANYLPFMALNQVIAGDELSHGRAAATVSVWLAAGIAVAWLLFNRRDAN